jgi:hypothetical protein
MSNGEGTQPLKGFQKSKFEFQNVNLNFKLTITTFQVYFGNSPTINVDLSVILFFVFVYFQIFI